MSGDDRGRLAQRRQDEVLDVRVVLKRVADAGQLVTIRTARVDRRSEATALAPM
jgi:hypothetical protein